MKKGFLGNRMKKCTNCKNADFYTDQFSGGKGFDCLKQRELEKILGEELVEDFFDGKVDMDCPLFVEVNRNDKR